MSGNIDVVIADGVARVAINHPGKLNAMSRAMWRELRAVFGQIQLDTSLRAVVIRGSEHFCAGGDISEYASFRFEKESLRDFHENDVWGGLQAMLDCDVPIVAQIEGNCMGAGVEIASCCDIRIADDMARFGAPIAKLGFPMAPREAALVLRAVGALTAREMLLSATVLDAGQMQQRGFLNQVVAVRTLQATVDTWVARICDLAPQAARLNKQSFRSLALVEPNHVAIDVIANAYCYASSAEHREGVAAFTETRTPRFTA
jgi:enoyl-CoA hydratase/carnithine racemase